MKRFVLLIVALFCAAAFAQTGQADELNTAIREASDYLNGRIPKGNKIVILNVQSESQQLSSYIIDELIGNAVNDEVFTVVDRSQIDAIESEQRFQMSGAVADNDALAIGRMFGAQTIVSGAVSGIGAKYSFRIRALDVQTAQVKGQFNRSIASSEILNSLGKSAAEKQVQQTQQHQVRQSKESKYDKSIDFTTEARSRTWALNVVPGLGSGLIMKDITGTIVNVAIGGTGTVLFALGGIEYNFADIGINGVQAMNYGLILCGAGSIWNIYRSITYHHPDSRKTSANPLQGINVAVLPDKDGNITGYAAYRMEF